MTASTRLKLIEEISGEAGNLDEWQKRAKSVLRITPETNPWLNDEDLLQFFHEEHAKYLEGERLSDGIGKGLW